MITPTVTEIPRTLNAVGRDTFIDDAAAVPHGRSWSRPTAARTRSVAPAQADSVRHLPVAARSAASTGARTMTFTRAA